MPELTLHLDIKPHELMAYYRGEARSVRARATTGQIVQLPASALHRFISADGIRGLFRIEFDDRNKFIRLVPAEPS